MVRIPLEHIFFILGSKLIPEKAMDVHEAMQFVFRDVDRRFTITIRRGIAEVAEGDPLPSVRSVAAEYRLNPLTVLKGYQQLVDEQLVEKRRGRGMFVSEGARRALLKGERQRFLEDEWPRIAATIQRLGFDMTELLEAAENAPAAEPTTRAPMRATAADEEAPRD